MTLKKLTSLVLIILMIIVIGGCQKKTQTDTRQITRKAEEITDPAELEKLWQEYLYDSIATIGNTREFNSAEEIDPLQIAEFAWFKYIAEHGEESLKPDPDGAFTRLFPLEIVMEYAQRYFNLTSLELTRIENCYNSEQKVFIFGMKQGTARPAYNSGLGWGEKLVKATKNGDGTITAVIARNDFQHKERIEWTKTYTLKEREDGSRYFVSGRWDYVNNHLVSLTGDFKRFDKIGGFTGNIAELIMVGEYENRIILAYTPYEKGKKSALLMVNPNTMSVETKLEFEDRFEVNDIRLQADKIVICHPTKLITVDKGLSAVATIPLPQAIKDKINRRPKYDQDGFADVIFSGYDVTSDLQKIVYADEKGVKLYNTADNSEKLLAKSVAINDRLIKESYHTNPRFVANEGKVITIMSGYECTMGYTICNLTDSTVQVFDEVTDSYLGPSWYDNGLLLVNSYSYDPKTQLSDITTKYLDIQQGEMKTVKLAEPGDTGYIRTAEYTYTGQNYAGFVTTKEDNADRDNSMFYINRLNLQTLQVEPKLISIKAGGPRILGVLADGRILVWYNLNPSENGLAITK